MRLYLPAFPPLVGFFTTGGDGQLITESFEIAMSAFSSISCASLYFSISSSVSLSSSISSSVFTLFLNHLLCFTLNNISEKHFIITATWQVTFFRYIRWGDVRYPCAIKGRGLFFCTIKASTIHLKPKEIIVMFNHSSATKL